MSNLRDKVAAENFPGPGQEYRSFFLVIEQFGVLKKFQNDLYRLTGLPFDFVDMGLRHSERLQAKRVFTPFCRMMYDSPAGRDACDRDEKKALDDCLKKQGCVLRRCHLGLMDVYVPVVMNNKVVGLLCTGQFFYNQISRGHFKKIRKRLAAMGIDTAKARKAYFNIPVVEKRCVTAIIDLIQMVVGLLDAGRLQALKTATRHDPMRKAMDFIEAHYADQVTLPAVAKIAGLSVSRLAHVFKAQVGMSFTAYLNLVRINWAKYYLTNSCLRVSEIAFQAGFGNLSHFNHVFRRSTGAAPTRYRQQQTSTRN